MNTTSTTIDPITADTPTNDNRVVLKISGMTCASCAARIGKHLNKLDGVTATVNYATENASITFTDARSVLELVEHIEAIGYRAEQPQTTAPASSVASADEDADEAELPNQVLPVRLIVSALLTTPVLALSMITPLQFRNWQWLAFALAWPVVLWGAWPMHRSAWKNLRHGAATMDTLISIGTLGAFAWSVYALFWGSAGMTGMKMSFSFTMHRGAGQGDIYLEVASAVTVFILAGRHFESRAKHRSGTALRALLGLGAKDSAVLRNGIEVRIPVAELVVGDRFIVRPGEKVATDGIIEKGSSAIDASLLTGESLPIDVDPGDPVTGATINTSGRLIVRATRVGADTALAHIARLVTDAQNGKATVQRLADQVSGIFVPVVIALAAATLGFWLGTGETVPASFTAAVAVLIIACPCALGLATPTALLVGTGRGAQMGILIKGPQVLESTRRIDTVVLDKTGTVTTGHMSLTEITPVEGIDIDELLKYVGALENASEHPVARAIAQGARERVGALRPVEHFTSLAGLGVEGNVDGHFVVAGRADLLAERDMPLTEHLRTAKEAAEARSHTAILVGWDANIRGLLVVTDTVKATSAAAIRELRGLGIEPTLLTGDNQRAARSVATSVGIETVIAEVLPADKVEAIKALQAQGRVVAMIGDGVNDAAALAQADLGIAMGTGSDVAIEASDLTLIAGDLLSVVDAICLSRRTLATIRTNLFWAFAYNTAAIPLAAAGLLNPLIAGASMGLSSVFVVANSLRLRSFQSVTAPSRTGSALRVEEPSL
jgi:P-type Cu+ transporter